jgi:membrane protease YdiL (CAAX protease family)
VVAWHLPLYLVGGTFQAAAVGTSTFWALAVAQLLGSIVYAWLYTVAGRVAVAAVVYHALSNVALEAVAVDGTAPTKTLVEGLLALALVLVSWRWMTRPAPPEAGPAADHRAGTSA